MLNAKIAGIFNVFMREYLLPAGMISGPLAQSLVETHQALPLAGTGLAFTGAQQFRWDMNGLQSRFFSALELQKQAEADPVAMAQLHAFIHPRDAFAGLALNKPIIMGVLNVTPDSFSDGGDHLDPAHALARTQEMLDEGAQIIDVGGESTSPGSVPPPVEEEVRRVVPVIRAIEGLVKAHGAKISIDTRRVMVMEAAMAAGAHIINDVSALSDDPLALDFIRRTRTPVMLTHKQGDAVTMQDKPHYEYASLEVYDYLKERVQLCLEYGLPAASVMVDPGIGFGKSLQHNIDILQHLPMYHGLGVGVMLGISRKAIIGALTGVELAKHRVIGSVAAAQYGFAQGVQVARVHDVKETAQMIGLMQGLQGNDTH